MSSAASSASSSRLRFHRGAGALFFNAASNNILICLRFNSNALFCFSVILPSGLLFKIPSSKRWAFIPSLKLLLSTTLASSGMMYPKAVSKPPSEPLCFGGAAFLHSLSPLQHFFNDTHARPPGQTLDTPSLHFGGLRGLALGLGVFFFPHCFFNDTHARPPGQSLDLAGLQLGAISELLFLRRYTWLFMTLPGCDEDAQLHTIFLCHHGSINGSNANSIIFITISSGSMSGSGYHFMT